jgi:hypothetical protein
VRVRTAAIGGAAPAAALLIRTRSVLVAPFVCLSLGLSLIFNPCVLCSLPAAAQIDRLVGSGQQCASSGLSRSPDRSSKSVAAASVHFVHHASHPPKQERPRRADLVKRCQYCNNRCLMTLFFCSALDLMRLFCNEPAVSKDVRGAHFLMFPCSDVERH